MLLVSLPLSQIERPQGRIEVEVKFLFATRLTISKAHELRHASFLQLKHGGFTMGWKDSQRRVPWAAINEFIVVQSSRRKKIVGWRYVSISHEPRQKPYRQDSVKDVDATLPHTYGVRPKDLAALMNELRRCYHMTERYSASAKQQHIHE